MGLSSSCLSKTEVRAVPGVNTSGPWQLVRAYDDVPRPEERPYDPFAAVRGDEAEPAEVWESTQLYPWAASTSAFTRRGAVLLRPLPEPTGPALVAERALTPSVPQRPAS